MASRHSTPAWLQWQQRHAGRGTAASAPRAIAGHGPTAALGPGGDSPAIDFGFPAVAEMAESGIALRPEEVLGKGSTGLVVGAESVATGERLACKIFEKNLAPSPAFPDGRSAPEMRECVRREVAILSKLRGSLSVGHLHGAWEDADRVYVVLERAEGGEILQGLGAGQALTERTVARVMQSVLRTLAVMHSHHILHRDVKPGNFLFLNGSPDTSPIKAVDFGIARFFEPAELPLEGLPQEGTPWFMSPELLRKEESPAADVWAAGVMAYQLLTGRLPFDDRKNRKPALSLVWRSILTDELPCLGLDGEDPATLKPYLRSLSAEARDFLRRLIQKDPAARPTALEALSHPFFDSLREEEEADGGAGAGAACQLLDPKILQKLQAFGQNPAWKRSAMQMVAEELAAQLRRCRVAEAPENNGPLNDSLMFIEDQYQELRRNYAMIVRHGHGDLHLHLTDDEACGRLLDLPQFTAGLQAMGFGADPAEAANLFAIVDVKGHRLIDFDNFANSLLDWGRIQSLSELWAESAASVFRAVDADSDGKIGKKETLQAVAGHVSRLGDRFREEDVQAALVAALGQGPRGAAAAPPAGAEGSRRPFGPKASFSHLLSRSLEGEDELDVEEFVDRLRVDSLDDLSKYDPRFHGRTRWTGTGSPSETVAS